MYFFRVILLRFRIILQNILIQETFSNKYTGNRSKDCEKIFFALSHSFTAYSLLIPEYFYVNSKYYDKIQRKKAQFPSCPIFSLPFKNQNNPAVSIDFLSSFFSLGKTWRDFNKLIKASYGYMEYNSRFLHNLTLPLLSLPYFTATLGSLSSLSYQDSHLYAKCQITIASSLVIP